MNQTELLEEVIKYQKAENRNLVSIKNNLQFIVWTMIITFILGIVILSISIK